MSELYLRVNKYLKKNKEFKKIYLIKYERIFNEECTEIIRYIDKSILYQKL